MKPRNARSIILAFDFYGSGNIGDDLMLAGFLEGLKRLSCSAQIVGSLNPQCNLGSQRRRFGSVEWIRPKEFLALGGSSWNSNATFLAGVGDTPVQITCGPWFLEHLLKLRQLFPQTRRVLINVGAESEAESRQDDFRAALGQFETISTRDDFSSQIISRLRGSPDGLVTGGDLAALALRACDFPMPGPARSGKYLLIASDTLGGEDLAALIAYLAGAAEPVNFLANDVRSGAGMERKLFRRLAPRRCLGLLRKGVMRMPDYAAGDWRSLVDHYREPEVVVSARYHGVLCAAYSGCRVGAIARSSKVLALARELKVPFCVPPLTQAKIQSVFKEACVVSPDPLAEMEQRALNGIARCLEL